MKKIKILPLILAFCLTAALLAPGALAAEEETLQPPELQSAAAIVTDFDSGRVLYAYNADEQRYPASLTKIMTVLLAIEAIERGEASLDDSVTAGDEAIQGMVEDGSTAGIQVGETMPLRDLLYCSMLSSANEACNIIAVHIAGSIDAFVEDMNERAAELGCTGTHFANTHGLPDSNHYTTARDFAVICRAAMSNPTFYDLSGTVSYTVPATNMSAERHLSNSNGLINPDSTTYPGNYYEYAVAGKTGHTTDAGYCLASMAEKDSVKLIAVVLGGQLIQESSGYKYTNFTDSRTLYEWVFNNFSRQEVLGATELVTSVAVAMAEDGGQAVLRPQTSISALVPNTGFDTSTIERTITITGQDGSSELTAPIAAGTVLGTITLTLDGVELGSTNLVTSGTVDLARSEYMKQEIAAFFSNIWVIIILIVLVAALALYIWSVARYRRLHKRHLESLARAEAREARREEEYFTPAPPAEERTTVMHASEHSSEARNTGELEKTTVLAGVGRRSAPSGSAEAPRRTSAPGAHRAGQTPQRPASPPPPPRPSAPRSGSASAPTGDKARRDYFEEFFRNNGSGSRGQDNGGKDE